MSDIDHKNAYRIATALSRRDTGSATIENSNTIAEAYIDLERQLVKEKSRTRALADFIEKRDMDELREILGDVEEEKFKMIWELYRSTHPPLLKLDEIMGNLNVKQEEIING